ncbi:hypothetical protein [Williamsia sp. 1135]|uniref:hypothetical protein n=1 Tax=Williamsia sp. 1135 TaxID=1889262 RepID=UPI00117E8DA8|nr:hypothetical protein [Williamsia sp. 1135]
MSGVGELDRDASGDSGLGATQVRADRDEAGASTPSVEQDLLWGDWGGVVAITAILATVIVVLTLTVGALPL